MILDGENGYLDGETVEYRRRSYDVRRYGPLDSRRERGRATHRLVGTGPKNTSGSAVRHQSGIGCGTHVGVVLQSGPLIKPRALHRVDISSWLDASACLFHVCGLLNRFEFQSSSAHPNNPALIRHPLFGRGPPKKLDKNILQHYHSRQNPRQNRVCACVDVDRPCYLVHGVS
jgi:hypothetical protein